MSLPSASADATRHSFRVFTLDVWQGKGEDSEEREAAPFHRIGRAHLPRVGLLVTVVVAVTADRVDICVDQLKVSLSVSLTHSLSPLLT